MITIDQGNGDDDDDYQGDDDDNKEEEKDDVDVDDDVSTVKNRHWKRGANENLCNERKT